MQREGIGREKIYQEMSLADCHDEKMTECILSLALSIDAVEQRNLK